MLLSGCGVDHAENTTGDSQTSDVIYEGAFLDNDEIADLFASVRGESKVMVRGESYVRNAYWRYCRIQV